jgi:hypothetical protein
MAFDRELAERTIVEVVDLFNDDRVVGTGFRLLEDVVATACRCLPRPKGEVSLPSPDHAGVLVLVRVRVPGTEKAASGIVVAADPRSGLALLRSATTAGLTVPDELNPVIPIERLIAGLEPAVPALQPAAGGRVHVRAEGGAWVECEAGPATLTALGGEQLGGATIGAPAVDEDGLVVGLVASVSEDGRTAGLCRLTDHLPGWALRKAAKRAELVAAAAGAGSSPA